MCDSCTTIIHPECSELSQTELRALALKGTTSIVFFCSECLQTFKQMPKLMKNLNKVLELNKTLWQENAQLRQQLEDMVARTNGDAGRDLNTRDEVTSEINERQARSNNLMIFNVNEPNGKTAEIRVAEDKKAALAVLSEFNIDMNDVKVKRIGRQVEGRCRPLRIKLKTKEDMKLILQNKNRIKIPSIKLSTDQTIAQRDYYRRR